jgi:hypothetical protein
VRVGDQATEVGVAPLVLRQEQERGVPALVPDRERGAEDRSDAFPLAGGGEPSGAVESVPIGDRHRRHLHLCRERGEVLGHERPFLQGEGRTDVEMDESPGPSTIEHMFDGRRMTSTLSRVARSDARAKEIDMDDRQVLDRINEIAHEEHELWEREGREEITDAERERLRQLGVTLDQCWDLLHQRRARRAAGQDPDQANVRDPGTVEGYLG